MPIFKSSTLQAIRRLVRLLPSRRTRTFQYFLLPLSIFAGIIDLSTIAVASRLAGSLIGNNLKDTMPGIQIFNTSIEHQAISLIVILIILSWASSFCKLTRMTCIRRLSSQVWRDIANLSLNKVVSQPYEFFLMNKSAVISSQLMLNIQRASESIVEPILILVSSTIVIASISIALILSIGIEALSLLILLGTSFILLSSFVVPYMRLAARQRVRLESLTNSIINQILSSIRDIHLTQSAKFFESRFRNYGEQAKQFQWRSKILPDLPRILIEPLAITFIFFYALLPLIFGQSNLDLGTRLIPFVSTFIVAAAKLTPPLQDLFRSITTLRGSLPQLDSALRYLELPTLYRGYQIESSVSPDGIFPRREITLEKVGYKYPNCEQAALKSISINIPVGSRIAIMGPTGSGKSTLSNIVLGHIEPTTGQIKLDGIPLEANDISSWQRCCSEVPQNITLLDGSFLENIAFGVPEQSVNFDEIWEVLSAAQLYDLVTEMPHGLYTSVGENGINLSGGQRQRLALARVFYRRSKFLILDEATSALDEKTESDVISALEIIGRRCTTVVIAHRINTLSKCDYIYEVNNGLIISSGTYQDLCNPEHKLGSSVRA